MNNTSHLIIYHNRYTNQRTHRTSVGNAYSSRTIDNITGEDSLFRIHYMLHRWHISTEFYLPKCLGKTFFSQNPDFVTINQQESTCITFHYVYKLSHQDMGYLLQFQTRTDAMMYFCD